MCNHLCNIKNTSAWAVQLSAFACEVSPKSVSSSHLPHTAVHIHHFDWSVRQSGILRVDVNLFFFFGLHVVEGYALWILHLPPNLLLSTASFFFCSVLCLRGCKFKSNIVRLLLSLNVLYVALGFVIASLLTPQSEQQQQQQQRVSVTVRQHVNCRRTDVV